MPARDRQPHGAQVYFTGQPDVGEGSGALLLPTHQLAGQIRLGRAAVAQYPDAQCRATLRQRCRTRVVHADHQGAAGRQPLDERVEHIGVGLLTAEEIQMVGLDIGHHRDIGGVLQQRTVTLVGLGDEDPATAVVGVGAGLPQVAADGEGRVESAVLQGDDQHRGGGGLPVRPGDQKGAHARHQLRQHRGAQDHRDRPPAGLDQFRVGLGDGGMGGDHRGRAARQQVEIRRVVADGDLRSASPQGSHSARLLGIGPRDLRTPIQQDSRDTRHPGAADSDHVDSPQFRRQFRGLVHRRAPCVRRPTRATSRTTRATRAAASRWPTPAAAAVMADSRAVSVINPATCPAIAPESDRRRQRGVRLRHRPPAAR